MSFRPQVDPNMILPVGTRVVITVASPGHAALGHPLGAMGRIVQSPTDAQHAYRVCFANGFEASYQRGQMKLLTEYQEGQALGGGAMQEYNLQPYIIFKSLVGSRAYGLDTPESDWDWRGIYLPPAEMHWSLYGVPEQLEDDATQEVFWEAAKFITLALKANPGVLECLYSPRVEICSPAAQRLIDMRDKLLSRLVYQTYGGYIMSQFSKIQSDIHNHSQPKWKHVMHLLRLLRSGTRLLREGTLVLTVQPADREKLLAIRDGRWTFEMCEQWRQQLHDDFDQAMRETTLPERPDYAAANDWLIASRRSRL